MTKNEVEEEHLKSQKAFRDAVESGRLSHDKTADNFAGKYMYMGTNKEGKTLFKDCWTRDYIK